MTLKSQLIAIFLLIGIFPTIFIGLTASYVASNSLERQAFSQLISVRDIKKSQITDYFKQRQNDIDLLTSNVEKILNFTNQETAASSAHDNHQLFNQYITKYEYYDLFIIDETGKIFYTVAKESDYRTNLIDGPYKDSGLGHLFRKAIDNKSAQISDFSRYAPSNNEPAAFIAKAFTLNDNKRYVVALQLSIEKINSIMKQRSGMGETGESYLIGADLLMRSDSYLDPKGHSVLASFAGNVAENGVDTVAARNVINGETSSEIIIDYNGNPVLSAYTPIDFNGLRWGLLSEIDVAEAMAPVEALYWNIFYVLVVTVLIVISAALILVKSIIKPLGGEPKEMRYISETLAQGNLAINFCEERHSESVYGAMKRMTLELKTLVDDIITNSDSLASVSEQTSSLSLQSSTSLKHQQTNIELIATAIDQMSITIEEVAKNAANVSNSTEAANRSASQASSCLAQTLSDIKSLDNEVSKTADVIVSLESDSHAIGNVLEVIGNIAEQTNLLALNAAIEAARAGEQGRGFAVVADEVRTLASKTQESTASIEAMIVKLQTASKNAVSAINTSRTVCEHTLTNIDATSSALKSMTKDVESIAGMTALIASSVEEQSSVSKEINESVKEVNNVAIENSASAEQVTTASHDIYQIANALRTLSMRFKTV
ncbi:methyl-accepting chemotaxis protein [Thalassotalea ganghwensis]